MRARSNNLTVVTQARHVSPVRLSTRGRLSVVGESHRQPDIAIVVSGRPLADAGNWDEVLEEAAYLVPEPHNPYDRFAVRVDMAAAHGCMTVGYISRDDAKQYQTVLLPLVERGLLPTCPGRLIEGGGGQTSAYLHVASPEQLTIENQPGDAALLEPERECAVIGENQHQEALARYVPGVLVWATLHPAVVKSGKGKGQPTLEVRLDGATVGWLSATQGPRYLTLLGHGGTVACEAQIFQGRTAREVRLWLPRTD